MKKIKKFFRDFLLYKIIESVLFFSIIFFSLKSIRLFLDFGYIEYISFLFFPFYFFKNKELYSFNRFVSFLDKSAMDNISYINLFNLNKVDEKYRFSKELIDKEIQRNKALIENKSFKINKSNLIKLFLLSLMISFTTVFLNSNFNFESVDIFYNIYPGNISALYGNTIEVGVDVSDVKEVYLNLIYDDTKEKILLSDEYNKKIKISSSFKYNFTISEHETDIYIVNAVKPIELNDILFTVKYPDYLKKDDEKIYGRNIELLKESSLLINPLWNKKVDSYEILIEDKEQNKQCFYKNNVFTIYNDIFYKIKAKDDYSEYISPLYSIKVLEDKEPYIKIIQPSLKNVVIQNNKFYIKYLCRDDFMLDSYSVELIYDNEIKIIKKALYHQKEIIDEASFDIEDHATVEVKIFDKKGNSYSEFLSVSVMDKSKALKEIFKKMQNIDKDVTENIENIKSSDKEIDKNLEKMFMKGQINSEDMKMLNQYGEKTKKSIDNLKKIDGELQKLQELAKTQELSKKINEKINSIRNMIDQLMNNELKKKLENINKLASKNKLSHSDYNMFNNEMKLKKMLKELDNTMKLFEKAKKENERLIIMEYLKEIREDIFSLNLFVTKNYKKEFGFLKGIKIRYQSIIDAFNSIKEFIECDQNDLNDIQDLFNKSLDMIFKDKDVFLSNQNIIIVKIDEIIKENEKKIKEQQKKEKDKVSGLLKSIYVDNLNILKNYNNISIEYFPGSRINDFGNKIIKNEELIKKIKLELNELFKISFILDSSILKLYEDTFLYGKNFFEKGKEGYNVSSYLNMGSRNIMNCGLKLIDAINRLSDMEQASALQDMMERIEEMNRMQSKLGKEMMELLSGEQTMQSMLEQFAQMQQKIRENMDALASQYMDGELNAIAQKMKELERQMIEQNPDYKEILQNQKKVREMFKKKLIHLTDKLNKKEYKGNSFKEKDPIGELKNTDIGKVNKSEEFKMPEDFPEIPDNIKKLVEDYMNASY